MPLCSSNDDYLNNSQANAIFHNAQTLPLLGGTPWSQCLSHQIYFSIATLLACVGLISNGTSLMAFARDRIRFTVSGVYLILFSTCGSMLTGLYLLNVFISLRNKRYFSQLWACHLYPYLFTMMSNGCLLMSAAIAVENILHRCFDLDRFRSRKTAVLISANLAVLVFLSNLDTIFARQVAMDRSGRFYCMYEEHPHRGWLDVSNSVASLCLIIVCAIHVLCIVFLLQNVSQTSQRWFQSVFPHLDLFLPSCLTVLCSLPYLVNRHGLSSNWFRVHLQVGCILLVNVPAILTFFVYVLPNRYYLREFQQWCVRDGWASERTVRKQAQAQEFNREYKNWQQQVTHKSVMTIATLNDHFTGSEVYDKIKLEV